MDAGWTVEGHGELTWWPSPLPMKIRVIGTGEFRNSGGFWLRVEGTTLIALVEESVGRQLANEYKTDYPVGALVYRDGGLHLTTICCFNAFNRSLLPWFHEALLIQAGVALDLVGEWMSIDGLTVASPPHPLSGERSDVDELVTIYGGEEFRGEFNNSALERFNIIRPMLREHFVEGGFRPGFSSDDVDFFNLGFESDDPSGPLELGAFDFAIGLTQGTSKETKFGPGLIILARLLPPGVTFDDDQVTFANEALCDLPETGVFGYVSGPELTQGSGLWAMVPHFTLSEWSNHSPEAFRDSIVNAVWHVTAAAQVLRSDVLGIHWP